MKKINLQFFEKHKKFVLPIAFILTGLLTAWISSPSAAPSVGPQAPEELSTFIPKGYLLIPIELRNAEQVESILGNHGFVDLYESPPGGVPQLVGRKLRLVRAPLNPRIFAVLVRESEANSLLRVRGPLTASIRANDEAAHEIVSRTTMPRIEIQKGDKL